ncbi:hypothetical protein K458DRAFT_292062 [Lentithecium fluviatile CBS 122367]|uniref:Uncharacterized protein n=1 Tax=Lentithecium fluviatile CBS 122367 TaxID=1168545 RepID=A0A6G1JFU8_9PLEO|nr:hypothetical protein K458DRAFT_292062 [Lentithecium fluviatile CBS 122367]
MIHFVREYSNKFIAPASEAIRLEVCGNDVFDHLHKSAYAGEPTEESDKAWDALILPTYLTIPDSDLLAAGETVKNSVRLKTGDVVAATGAYHELHCIRQVRPYVYKDTYYPNLTTTEENYLRGHLDHCLEVLREQIMCLVDISIVTFSWQSPPQRKPVSKSNSKRVCADWKKFEQWSLDHTIPLDVDVKGGTNPLWVKERVEH